MFNNSRLEKIKEVLLFVLKSAIFLYIADKFLLAFFAMPMAIIMFSGDFIPLNQYLFVLCFRWVPHYIYGIVMYFTAKKLEIIKVLDNSPLWVALVLVFIFQIILALNLPINLNHESFGDYFIHQYKRIIKGTFAYSIIGVGFINTFIGYKAARFLINKYPKRFGWLMKLYPSKLEEVISFANFGRVLKKLFKKPEGCWNWQFFISLIIVALLTYLLFLIEKIRY